MRSPDICLEHLGINQAKLDRVVEILDARSEADAIGQALSLLFFRDDLVKGISRIGGSGRVDDVG